MKNFFFSRNISLFLVFNFLMLALGLSQQSLANNATYSELLNSCAAGIYDLGYDSDKVSLKLDKKFEKAGNYRFWINIVDIKSKQTTKAYCSGKKKDGIVNELEILK